MCRQRALKIKGEPLPGFKWANSATHHLFGSQPLGSLWFSDRNGHPLDSIAQAHWRHVLNMSFRMAWHEGFSLVDPVFCTKPKYQMSLKRKWTSNPAPPFHPCVGGSSVPCMCTEMKVYLGASTYLDHPFWVTWLDCPAYMHGRTPKQDDVGTWPWGIWMVPLHHLPGPTGPAARRTTKTDDTDGQPNSLSDNLPDLGLDWTWKGFVCLGPGSGRGVSRNTIYNYAVKIIHILII